MNKIIKNTIILTIITLVSGVALGAVYEITKAPIANAQEEAKQEAYKQVFEDADSFDDLEVDAKEAAEAVKAWMTVQRSMKQSRQNRAAKRSDT